MTRPLLLGDGLAGLRGNQVVLETAEAAGAQLATVLAEHARRSLALRPECHMALSGGSSARLLGRAFADRPMLSKAEWARVHVWTVDERCVPEADPRLNANLLKELLVTTSLLPAANLHAMPVLRRDGDHHYEAALHAALDAQQGRFDALVLGMGGDGHTASLFPHSPALDERRRWVVMNDGEQVSSPRPRMTMTFPLINQAAFIALLVTGQEKHSALVAAAATPDDVHVRPVVGIAPSLGGRLFWLLDRAAREGTSA